MKIPFDLEKWQTGKYKVETYNGKPVTIIETDLKNNEYPIVAKVFTYDTDKEEVQCYTKDGYYDKELQSNHRWNLCLIDTRPITERIKTFEDAYNELIRPDEFFPIIEDYNLMADTAQNLGEHRKSVFTPQLTAFAKLRIITAAFNSEPTDKKRIQQVWYDNNNEIRWGVTGDYDITTPISLMFKCPQHAKYCARQFEDLYREYYQVLKK